MTISGTPSRAISTAWACRSWCGAKRRRIPASRATRRSSERAAAAAQGRPRVAPLMTQNGGPTGSSTRASIQGASCSHAQSSISTSRRRPLFAPDQQRIATRIQIGLGERERLVDRQAGAPQHDDQAAQPATVDAVAGAAHDRNDLLDRRRVGRVAHPLVARRPAGVEFRQRGGGARAAGGIKQRLGHDPSSGVGYPTETAPRQRRHAAAHPTAAYVGALRLCSTLQSRCRDERCHVPGFGHNGFGA